MALGMGRLMLQSGLTVLDIDASERSCTAAVSCMFHYWCRESSFNGLNTKMGILSTSFLPKSFLTGRQGWKLAFALDGGELPGNGGQDDVNSDRSELGRTRLGRILSAGGRQLLKKLTLARKNLPMKVFLLLLGFYTANALATILGQTGDWDVLVAGIVVSAIEGIGMLMYKKLPSISIGRLQSFIVMMNYWKAGVCLGLFVDAFKLGNLNHRVFTAEVS